MAAGVRFDCTYSCVAVALFRSHTSLYIGPELVRLKAGGDACSAFLVPLHVAGVGRLVVTSKERLRGDTASSGSGAAAAAVAAAAAAATTAVLRGSDAARLGACCSIESMLLRRLCTASPPVAEWNGSAAKWNVVVAGCRSEVVVRLVLHGHRSCCGKM